MTCDGRNTNLLAGEAVHMIRPGAKVLWDIWVAGELRRSYSSIKVAIEWKVPSRPLEEVWASEYGMPIELVPTLGTSWISAPTSFTTCRLRVISWISATSVACQKPYLSSYATGLPKPEVRYTVNVEPRKPIDMMADLVAAATAIDKQFSDDLLRRVERVTVHSKLIRALKDAIREKIQ